MQIIKSKQFNEILLTKAKEIHHQIPHISDESEESYLCKLLSYIKCPLVVHSGKYDLLFFYNQFIDSLPNSREELF